MGGSGSTHHVTQVQVHTVDETAKKTEDEIAARKEAANAAEAARIAVEEAREEERKRYLADVDALKRRVIDYEVGNEKCAGGATQKAKIQAYLETLRIRICVFGPTGSGKSSFWNVLFRAMGIIADDDDPDFAPTQSLGNEGTVRLEEYRLSKLLSAVDTRGFYNLQDFSEFKEFEHIVMGRIPCGELIVRQYDGQEQQYLTNPHFADGMKGVIFIVKGDDPRLLEQDVYKNMLTEARQWMRMKNLIPIAVITHVDLLSSEQQNVVKTKASEAIGCSLQDCFMINCRAEKKTPEAAEAQLLSLQAVIRCISRCERYMLHQVQQENRSTVLQERRNRSPEIINSSVS